jgi:hypothetical protein
MNCTIHPIIGDDDTTIEGWAAFVNGQQVTDLYPNKTAAAVAAEGLGYNPWMTDDELEAENEAMQHGDWRV